MFTKNIKLIGIVALIVVIVMVLSAVIAINNDKKVSTELGTSVEDLEASYEKKIAELNDAIASLKTALGKLETGLADANAVIEAQKVLLEKLGAEGDAWASATAVTIEKIEAAQEIVYDYVDYVDEETGITADMLYDYIENYENKFFDMGTVAIYAIMRATSIDEMDAILAGLEADLDAVPTRVEAIEAAIAELEADAIVYGDYASILAANTLVFEANDKIFAPADEEAEYEGEFAAFVARLDAITVAFAPVVLDHFVEVAATLPEAYAVVYSHKETIETLMLDAQLIVNLFTEEELDEITEDEEFMMLVDKYLECVERLPVVVALYEDAEDINEWLAEQLKDVEIKATLETRYFLNGLYTVVNSWISEYEIVVDVDAKDYVAEIYNYVDHSVLAACEATLREDGKKVLAEAEAFITVVDGISKITPDSKTELDAAVLAYKAVSADPATIDTIFALENGVVAAWDELLALQEAHEVLLATIKNFNDAIDAVIIKCDESHAEDEECDCEHLGEINTTLAAEVNCDLVDSYILTVLGVYELDITVFKAELVDAYKTIRLYDDLKVIADRIADAASRSTLSEEDLAKQIANVQALILVDAATAYTFEVAVEECECGQICVGGHDLVIVENAAEKALATWTQSYVDGFFAVELPVIGGPVLE